MTARDTLETLGIDMIAAFFLGFKEGTGVFGMTYDDDPTSPRSRAYDAGRNIRRRIARLD